MDSVFQRKVLKNYNSHIIIMKKQVNLNMNYKGVSASERCLLSLVNRNGLAVFGVNEAARISGWNRRKVHNTLQSLEKKGFVLRLKRNAYTLKSLAEENAFRVATSVVTPSYLSFWSALSFYGFTEQQVSAIQLVSTRQERELKLADHRIQTTVFKPERFFGYERVNGFNIAEKEKALIDSLFQPEKSGGLSEVAKCLKNSWQELNKQRFFKYLLKFNSKSLNSRVGFLLEKLSLANGKGMLLKNRSKGFVKLNPRLKKTSTYNKEWRIIVNQEILEGK